MRNLRELRGQKIAGRLLGSYLGGNIPPLLILYGPEGTGKFSAADAFVQQRLCTVGTGCDTCASCRKFARGDHPDYIRFPEERIAIGEPENPEPFTIRWLLRTRVRYAPFEAEYRFVLFPRADLIQHEAETALLKTLEEPPSHTRFLMLTRDRGELKDTILSRGVEIPFQRLPLEEMRAIGELPEEHLPYLGGSMHLAPFFLSEFYKRLAEGIKEGLRHPLALLELEKLLLAEEKKKQHDDSPGFAYTYDEILDVFSMIVLGATRSHPHNRDIAEAVFEFKRDLHAAMPGLNVYLISRLFHALGQALFARA